MQTKKLRLNSVVDVYLVFSDLVFIRGDYGNYTGTRNKDNEWVIEQYDWTLEEFLTDWEVNRPPWVIPKRGGYVQDILKKVHIL